MCEYVCLPSQEIKTLVSKFGTDSNNPLCRTLSKEIFGGENELVFNENRKYSKIEGNDAPSMIAAAAAGSANHISQEIDYNILLQDFESALKMEFKELVS